MRVKELSNQVGGIHQSGKGENHMPRDKSSKRRERKMLDYKGRPYKNSLASASFILNPDFARAVALTLHDDDRVIGEYGRAIEKAEAEDLAIQDTTGLTDADWAEINKLRNAHKTVERRLSKGSCSNCWPKT